MNIGPEQPGREPLTPEEREWAQRLSRLGPSAGPPSAIDARILAAAHDAVAARPRPRAHARERRRWPVALGVAASLALAVGIAWRLRPLPEVPQASSESDVAASRAAGGPAPPADVAFEPRTPVVVTERAPPPPPPPPEPPKAAFIKKIERRQAPQYAPPAPIVTDESRTADAMSAPAPATPPPPANAAAEAEAAAWAANAGLAAGSAKESERLQKAAEATAQRAKAAAATAAESAAADSAMRREAAPEKQVQEDLEIVGSDDGDEPPAYATSPQVREAWLRRIRELIAEGHPQEAHDSLDEFKRRYPQHPLPDDLKRFEQSKHDPAVP